MTGSSFLSFATTAILTAALVFAYLGAARRRGVLDHPGARSSHLRPTPTGAGIALVVAMIAVSLAFRAELDGAPAWAGVLAGAALLSLVGLWDDVRGVSAWLRLITQIAVAGAWVTLMAPVAPVLMPVVLLGLVWTMNAYNFMDGSNGMAAGQALFTGLLLAIVFTGSGLPALALAALILAGAAAGFLPWNLGNARVFMGDAGSVPLGFMIAALCLLAVQAEVFPWPTALVVLAVFHVDAGLTLLGRLRRGEQWYTAHRQHVYQRLIAQGRSHGQVLRLYVALNFIVVAPVVIVTTLRPEWGLLASIVAVAALVAAWSAVSLKLGERP